MSEDAWADGRDDPVVARSFVVRALLEGDAMRRGPASRWHGFVTDAQTGTRGAWRRPADVSRFIEDLLAAPGGADMAGPALTDVVTEMLAVLAQRLPAPVPGVPESNVTLERAADKPVGLGTLVGVEPAGTLGAGTVHGGHLDARVRFQLWADSPTAVDDAMQTLHATLLDDGEALRSAGFLTFTAAGTSLAELVGTIPAWRKTTSVDVLYEYRYVDTDDTSSLIAQIPVASDVDHAGGAAHEVGTVRDELVRWDQESAPALVVHGPRQIARISALAYLPGPALGGEVVIARTSGGGGPVTALVDLDAFLVATTGRPPALRDAQVVAAPAAALAALGPSTPGPLLGDWDSDGTLDAYTGTDRRLDAPIDLASASDRFEIRYTPPPGPVTGLDQTAVVYLRVDAP